MKSNLDLLVEQKRKYVDENFGKIKDHFEWFKFTYRDPKLLELEREIILEQVKEIKNKKIIKLQPHDDIGDLMTFEDFKDCVDCGGFIDSDGFGYWSNESGYSDFVVKPSHFEYPELLRDDFKYVLWFNK